MAKEETIRRISHAITGTVPRPQDSANGVTAAGTCMELLKKVPVVRDSRLDDPGDRRTWKRAMDKGPAGHHMMKNA